MIAQQNQSSPESAKAVADPAKIAQPNPLIFEMLNNPGMTGLDPAMFIKDRAVDKVISDASLFHSLGKRGEWLSLRDVYAQWRMGSKFEAVGDLIQWACQPLARVLKLMRF